MSNNTTIVRPEGEEYVATDDAGNVDMFHYRVVTETREGARDRRVSLQGFVSDKP
jgi:hypothetical protein